MHPYRHPGPVNMIESVRNTIALAFCPLSPPSQPPILTEATVTSFVFSLAAKGNHHFLPRQNICDPWRNGRMCPVSKVKINGASCGACGGAWLMPASIQPGERKTASYGRQKSARAFRPDY